MAWNYRSETINQITTVDLQINLLNACLVKNKKHSLKFSFYYKFNGSYLYIR